MENKNYRMNDIHMHIIPAVDDGSWSLDMSYSMLYMAYLQGIRKIIATPHSSAFDCHLELVTTTFEELKKQVAQTIPEIELYLGCEVYCKSTDMESILGKLQLGIYPFMNQTKYVLIEFSARVQLNEVLFCTNELLTAGWIPIIAHVERYKNLFTDETYIHTLKENGCLLQINVYSVCDEYDEKIKQNAIELVKQKYVDFLATDAHRMNHRPPDAENGLCFLYSNFEADYVDKIAYGNSEQFLLM